MLLLLLLLLLLLVVAADGVLKGFLYSLALLEAWLLLFVVGCEGAEDGVVFEVVACKKEKKMYVIIIQEKISSCLLHASYISSDDRSNIHSSGQYQRLMKF